MTTGWTKRPELAFLDDVGDLSVTPVEDAEVALVEHPSVPGRFVRGSLTHTHEPPLTLHAVGTGDAPVEFSSSPYVELVPDLTVTVPASDVARLVAIDVAVAFVASEHRRFRVLLDGVEVFPRTGSDSEGILSFGGHDGRRQWTVAGLVVAVPGDDAAHDIEVFVQAHGNEDTTTFEARSMVVRGLPGDVPPSVTTVATDEGDDDAAVAGTFVE